MKYFNLFQFLNFIYYMQIHILFYYDCITTTQPATIKNTCDFSIIFFFGIPITDKFLVTIITR